MENKNTITISLKRDEWIRVLFSINCRLQEIAKKDRDWEKQGLNNAITNIQAAITEYDDKEMFAQ